MSRALFRRAGQGATLLLGLRSGKRAEDVVRKKEQPEARP